MAEGGEATHSTSKQTKKQANKQRKGKQRKAQMIRITKVELAELKPMTQSKRHCKTNKQKARQKGTHTHVKTNLN